MAMDCTLHLVDPEAIRAVLVPAVLGSAGAPAALEDRFAHATDLVARVQTALASEAPDRAAALLCELAVLFASTSLPHESLRDVSLGLWPVVGPRGGAFPKELRASPEELFGPVLEAHPQLRGAFPDDFGLAARTGVYLSPTKVAMALGWIEARLAGLPKGEREAFVPLLRVLRAARRLGIGYWEAADLGVAAAPKSLLDDGLPGGAPGLLRHRLPIDTFARRIGGASGRLVLGDLERWQTVLVDVSRWPPHAEVRAGELATLAARSESGRWALRACRHPEERPRQFKLRLHSSFSDEEDDVAPALPGGVTPDGPAFVEDQLFAAGPASADATVTQLWQLGGNGWEPVPGLPGAPLGALPAAIRLPSNKTALWWAGDVWELGNGVWERSFALGLSAIGAPDGAVVVDENRFFVVHAHALWEVRRGQGPVRHAFDGGGAVLGLQHGPGGGLLVHLGRNRRGDVGEVYFPDEKASIGLDPDLLSADESAGFRWVGYLAEQGLVVALRHDTLLALPEAAVLASSRRPVRTS